MANFIKRSLGKIIFSSLVLFGFLVLSRNSNSAERKINRIEVKSEESCKPLKNIGFLKTHKCASSSIQNMLFRYGMKNNLTFALPGTSNRFGKPNAPFESWMVSSAPWNRPDVNIFAIHTKWNYTEMEKLMPNDTVFFTIIREPTETFESLFSYANLDKIHGKNLSEYVKAVTKEDKNKDYLGYNQMVYDFGLPNDQFNRETLSKMIPIWDKHFSLVMLADRLEESLILLKEILCWNLEDILLLKTNARDSKYKIGINTETRLLLQDRLSLDYLLYDYFSKKFSKRVKKFGKDRMKKEIIRLREAAELLFKKCNLQQKDAHELRGSNKVYSEKVSGFQTDNLSEECRSLARSELSYVELLLQRQKRLRSSGRDILDQLPLGAVNLRQNDLTSIVDALKKSNLHSSHKITKK